jgi:hypothetical protein
VQSESAKHTSVHSFAVGSQNWLSQSVSLPHEAPSAAWPPPPGTGKQAATMPAVPAVDTTYAHDDPDPPQSGVFRQALLHPALPLHSSLLQSLLRVQVDPF